MSEQIMFYILSATILVFSLLTVTTRSILRAATFLLFVLIATAGMYFLIHYNFMAAVQLTVYAGGIVVLIIFSILLTHRIHERMEEPTVLRKVAAGLIAAIGAGFTIVQILSHDFQGTAGTDKNAVHEIGTALLTYGDGGFVLPFEVISVLLLAAMIGAIAIAKRRKIQE